ncbi:MAG: hypothetical protein PVI60_01430 [Desulfobacteraceae bacterium]
MMPKVIRGYQYIAFTGYAGRRIIITSPIYKANNIKLVNLAIGRLGVVKSIAKGTVLTLALTIPLSTAESMLKAPGDLYYLFGHLAADIVKVGVSVLFMSIAGVGLTGSTIIALFPMGVVIAIGVFTGFILNEIDEKHKLTDKLIDAMKKMQYKAEAASQFAGEGIWRGIINPGGGLRWGRMF